MNLSFIMKYSRGNMKNRTVLFAGWLISLLVVLSCSISLDGITFGEDPSDTEKMATQMAIGAIPYQEENTAVENEPAGIVEPARPIIPSGGNTIPEDKKTRAYSVEAANYDCICAVDGDVEVEFNFKGNTLEVANDQGGPTIYEKVGENTYFRSFMGYYILRTESGDTEIEEEKRVVITFTDTGCQAPKSCTTHK